MAKVTITGIRTYDFADKENNRQVQGMSVYYKVDLEPRNGNSAKGFNTEKLDVKSGTELYAKMLNAPVDKAPISAEVKYDIVPGSKRPVLTDIQF